MANIRDEIRKLMAIHGMYKLYRKPQMTQKSMFQFLEDQFHGNDAAGIVSQVSQVFNGLPPYNALYKKQTDIVTNSSVSSSTSVTSLVLKKEMSQCEAVIIAGRDITVSVLENTTKTSKELVKGRKLFTDANTALKNIRKYSESQTDVDTVVPFSHSSAKPSSNKKRLCNAQQVCQIESVTSIPCNLIPVLIILNLAFNIPKVHSTSFLIDSIHSENLNSL
jgi:hypothetical protein